MMTLLRELLACLTGVRADKYNLAVRHLEAVSYDPAGRGLQTRNW